MSLDPTPSARELRAMAEKRGVAVGAVAPPKRGKAAKMPAVREWAPFRSRLERDYAGFLTVLKGAGIIAGWEYEPERLQIGFGAYFTPDFRVTNLDGRREWHEVKGGYPREAGMVRLRVAASLYRTTRFFLVTRKLMDWQSTAVTP